ncbi:MAG: hypothetical protein ACI9RZ_001044, partial [Sphingobacteriales bacterium]
LLEKRSRSYSLLFTLTFYDEKINIYKTNVLQIIICAIFQQMVE